MSPSPSVVMVNKKNIKVGTRVAACAGEFQPLEHGKKKRKRSLRYDGVVAAVPGETRMESRV